MGRGRTRRKTRGSPGGDGGQLPDVLVFWFTFSWDLIYVQKLGVSSQSPLQPGGKARGMCPGCGCPSGSQFSFLRVQGLETAQLGYIQYVGAPGSW